MKQSIPLILLVCIAVSIQAQNTGTKQRAIDLSIGWQKFTMLDKQASPLAYSTNSIFPTIGLSFKRQTSNSDFAIGISGTKGNLTPTRFGSRQYTTKFGNTPFGYNVASQFYHVNINAAYYRKVQSLSTGKVNYWAGGVLNEAGYYADAIANMPYVFNELDLSPSVKVDYTPFHQHSFGIKIDIAILGLLTRMPYYWFPKSNQTNNVVSYFKQGSHLNTVNKFQKINWQLSYQYQAARHLALGASYSAKWLQSSDIKKLAATDNHFDLHFLYTY